MKKFLFIALLLASVLTCAFPQQSGSCGDNLTWTLDEDGTLTISGTGEMYDYGDGGGPWGNEITQLIIEEGITHIGSYAFAVSWGLTELSLPTSLTSIGEFAFAGCRFTGFLTLPTGLISIGASAFSGCSGFTGELSLPAGLTSLGESAFRDCVGFTGSLILPTGLVSIGEYAFNNCYGFTELSLPAGLTSIGEYAFEDCRGFTGSLILPAGLINLGESAFTRCIGFTDTLLLPESLLSIGSSAFAFCGFSVVLNENKNPITITMDVFENLTFSDTKLCVPAGSRAIYSQAEVWKEFSIEEYGVGITPSFSENGGTVDCGTEISISTKPEAELYYGLGKDAAPTMRYTGSIAVKDTTYISAYSRVRNVYSDTVYAKYIPIHETSFSKVDWDWSSEHKATLSLTCSRCQTKLKPAVSISEELTKEATEEEAGLKTYTATATAPNVTYKNTYREVLPRLTQPIHDTVVKTDTIVITDTVYIEVGTGNTVNGTMKMKLYPNPTNGSFTVETEEGAYLQIYNAAGVCIQSKQMRGGRFTGSLPSSGLYFIKLTARNRTYTKRLVVQ